MIINVGHEAGTLKVEDIWKAGNSTGIVTDPVLYNPAVRWTDGKVYAPPSHPPEGLIMHATAIKKLGQSSLRFLAEQTVGGNWACINYLVPEGDNPLIYKLVPDGFMANHVGIAEWRGRTDLNGRFLGIENEKTANWQDAVEVKQIIKCALIWCYESAKHRLLDINVLSHSLVAVPHGRRSDPESSLFAWAMFWDFCYQIRRNWPWGTSPALWLGGNPPD